MTTGVIAPKGGYDFGNKRDYRRRVWGVFRRHNRGITKQTNVLFMPSRGDEEIVLAERAGVPNEHMFIVDRNAAVVAVHRRRRPALHTYGVPVLKALLRHDAEAHPLGFVHLDYCGNVGAAILNDLINLPPVLRAAGATVVINTLKGREARSFRTAAAKHLMAQMAEAGRRVAIGRFAGVGKAFADRVFPGLAMDGVATTTETGLDSYRAAMISTALAMGGVPLTGDPRDGYSTILVSVHDYYSNGDGRAKGVTPMRWYVFYVMPTLLMCQVSACLAGGVPVLRALHGHVSADVVRAWPAAVWRAARLWPGFWERNAALAQEARRLYQPTQAAVADRANRHGAGDWLDVPINPVLQLLRQ